MHTHIYIQLYKACSVQYYFFRRKRKKKTVNGNFKSGDYHHLHPFFLKRLCKLQITMSSPLDNCQHPSSFFKVIAPSRIFQLSIPKAFRPYLQHIEIRNAILRRDNKRWQVKIVGDWMFGEGWENFVRDNCVEDRNFVVFNHLGNLVFDTTVYDTEFDEKEYPNNQDTIGECLF